MKTAVNEAEGVQRQETQLNLETSTTYTVWAVGTWSSSRSMSIGKKVGRREG